MKILITGITGFVGQNICTYLKNDFNIKGISRQQSPLSLTYEDYYNNKEEAFAIVHLAGKAHDLKKVSNPQEYYKANFELTKQLFDAYLLSEVSLENKNHYA